MFAGSSHVTRTLSVEPGIPGLRIGAPGADGWLRPVRYFDSHRLGGDAVVLPLAVVHLDRQRVFVPLFVVEGRPRPYLPGSW